MGVLIEDILRFLATDNGDGYGYGSGNGYGDDSGNGYGYGSGSGDDSGNGYGYGDGDGYGYSSGNGYGYGYGDGYGDCDGDGYSSGNGYSYGIKSINGNPVFYVDGMPTTFEFIRGNVARGHILQKSLILRPCYIVKGESCFAHGDTLHEAYAALMEKLYESSPVEARIDRFNEDHASYDRKYEAKDLFHWHHILTGSCKAGREAFCTDHGIDIDNDKFTIHEFIKLTENAYGGNIIKQLKQQQ